MLFMRDASDLTQIVSIDGSGNTIKKVTFHTVYVPLVLAPINKFFIINSGTHPEHVEQLITFYKTAVLELRPDAERTHLPTRTRLIRDLVDALDRDIDLVSLLTEFVVNDLEPLLPTETLSMEGTTISFTPTEYVELVVAIMLSKFMFPIWSDFSALVPERNGVDTVVDPSYYHDMTTAVFPKSVDDKMFWLVSEICHEHGNTAFQDHYEDMLTTSRCTKTTLFADLVTNGFVGLDPYMDAQTLLNTIKQMVITARDRAMSNAGQ